jgi:hypothetical protein
MLVAWGRRERREEGGEGELAAEHHLFRPPLADWYGREANVSRKKGWVRFLAISERRGSETSYTVVGIWEHLMEFGPNSGPKFHTTPNIGIRVRILQFLILGPILYIQT